MTEHISIIHLGSLKAWARDALCILSSSSKEGWGVSLIPHNADVMHLRLQEARVRAEQAECVWEIKWVQMNLQSRLNEEASVRIFVTSDYWYSEASGRSPVTEGCLPRAVFRIPITRALKTMHGEQRTETTAQGSSNRGGHIKNNKTHTVAIMFHIFSDVLHCGEGSGGVYVWVKGEEAHPPQRQASESTDDRNVASWQKLPVYNISAARELPFYVISFKSGFRVCTHAEPTNHGRVIRYETIISIASLKSHSQETFFDVM